MWVCWCQLPFNIGRWAGAEDVDSGEEDVRSCDDAETCICTRPADQYPDHGLVTTLAARAKYMMVENHALNRNPYHFGMDLGEDHYAFGLLQIVENLLLDFAEAKGNLREQWVVCETMVIFLLSDMAEPIAMYVSIFPPGAFQFFSSSDTLGFTASTTAQPSTTPSTSSAAPSSPCSPASNTRASSTPRRSRTCP